MADTGKDAKLFQRGKVQELRAELLSEKKDKGWVRKKTVLKKIIANATTGATPAADASQDSEPTPATPITPANSASFGKNGQGAANAPPVPNAQTSAPPAPTAPVAPPAHADPSAGFGMDNGSMVSPPSASLPCERG